MIGTKLRLVTVAVASWAFYSQCCQTITAFVSIRSTLSWVAAISGKWWEIQTRPASALRTARREDIEGGEPNWPKYALLGHAVELALKAVPKYFEQSRAYQKPKTVKPANHDLVGQYRWAKLHGLASNELVEADLPILSELHKDHYARYPQPRGQVWLPSGFDDLVDQIIADVEKILRLR